MKRLVAGALILFGVIVAFGVGSFASATSEATTVRANLNGYQEVPSISSSGFGEFEATIDDEAMTITYELTYAALEGTVTTQAHIHPGQRGVNGGVAAFLCGGAGKPPCPPTAGTVTGVITPLDVIGPAGQGIAPGEFRELVQAMRVGHTYANVHTNKHPGGEIRGQIHNLDQRENDLVTNAG